MTAALTGLYDLYLSKEKYELSISDGNRNFSESSSDSEEYIFYNSNAQLFYIFFNLEIL